MTQATSQLPSEIHHMNAANKSTATQPSMEDLWSLESIGINPKSKAERDDLVMESFKKTISRQPDGRYKVYWPWRKENLDIKDNYELALGRLKSLIKRFDQNKTLRQRYDDIIKEQLQNAIIEEINDKEISDKPRHYIPHHAVITPEKSTTKLRVVYDASAKTKKGSLSLNECLHRGPVILEDLCGLLLQFRAKKIEIIADIEKAFLQVALKPQDRDVTRFLWLKDINGCATKDNIQTYRFTRLPFGIISSPFLLSGTISHHLELDAPDTAIQVKDDIYVDNLITGADNEKDALELYQNCKKIFGEASMNLRDWLSNSQELNCNFREDDKMEEKITKVLGLIWNVKLDTLSIPTKTFIDMQMATTKRAVLTAIASIFDPLGLLTPATLHMKLFLQELWDRKMDWDDKLSFKEMQRWKVIMNKLKNIDQNEVPRFVGPIIQKKLSTACIL